MADKPLVLLHGEIKSPPFSSTARLEAGSLLRKLQQGIPLGLPSSRPMPSIGRRCHELRIPDAETRLEWRVIYRLDSDAVLIADVFAKKTQKTPPAIIRACQGRLKHYDAFVKEQNETSKATEAPRRRVPRH
jgi:phage-related protein